MEEPALLRRLRTDKWPGHCAIAGSIRRTERPISQCRLGIRIIRSPAGLAPTRELLLRKWRSQPCCDACAQTSGQDITHKQRAFARRNARSLSAGSESESSDRQRGWLLQENCSCRSGGASPAAALARRQVARTWRTSREHSQDGTPDLSMPARNPNHPIASRAGSYKRIALAEVEEPALLRRLRADKWPGHNAQAASIRTTERPISQCRLGIRIVRSPAGLAPTEELHLRRSHLGAAADSPAWRCIGRRLLGSASTPPVTILRASVWAAWRPPAHMRFAAARSTHL